MQEFTVKVKDYQQNITHTVKQWATSKNEANQIVLRFLRNSLGHNEFEVL